MTTARIGDNVRITDDRGTGTRGAIGRVQQTYPVATEPLGEPLTAVVVDVHGKDVHLHHTGVQVVHYDRDTREWAEGRS